MRTQSHLLYRDISGNDIFIRSYTFGSGKKSVFIQGGVHGGEVTYFIFDALFHWLTEHESQLPGEVTFVPVVNPTAWNQRVYYYTAGKFDFYKGTDWNRSYPGKETSLSAHNSMVVYDLSREYEFVIDLHTARFSCPYIIYMQSSLQDFVACLPIPFKYFIDISRSENKKYGGTLTEAVIASGRKSITIECGSHDSYDPVHVSSVVTCLQRIVGAHSVENQAECDSTFFDKVDVVYSPISGFARYHLQPGAFIQQDQLICEILDSTSLGAAHRVVAPMDMILLELPKTHIVWHGDELVRYVPKASIFK